jgi:putative sigma-54 modulation protein
MQVSVTARKMEMTPALKSYAKQKVQKITKHLERVIDAHIVLSVEKYRHKVEVTINANGFMIRGEEITGDMYSAIDQVMDKLDAQITKHKSKLNKRGRQRRAERPTREVEELSSEEIEFTEVEEEDLEADETYVI